MRQLPHILLVLVALGGSLAWGESANGYVDIYYDASRDKVVAYATTDADYNTWYYYDTWVEVWLYAGGSLVTSKSAWGWNGTIATTSVETAAQPGTDYSARSSHEIQVQYEYYQIDSGCLSGCYDWYDAYGYSFIGGQPPIGGPTHSIWVWAAPIIMVIYQDEMLYLGDLYKELPAPVPVLHVYNGSSTVYHYGSVYTTAGSPSSPPTVPPLTAILTSASSAITTNWRIHVTYNGHGRSDSNYFPSSSGRVLNSTATWDIQQDFSGNVRGGTATIEWVYGSQPTRTFTFYLRGTSPPEATAKTHLGNNPWFLTRIARAESGIQQFAGSDPKFNGPNGWGLMQLDPPPGPQEIWSWWTNIDVGKQRVNQKDSQLAPAWNQRVTDWNEWNNANPGAEVPPPAPRTEAGCTFTWGGSQSFRDACWIKRYNGIPNGDYLIWDNFTDPDHPNWDYRPLNNLGQNYVHQVCSQAP